MGFLPLVLTCSLRNRVIAWVCWLVLTWSRMLLVQIDSALESYFSLKLLLVAIFTLNLVHTAHCSLITIFFVLLTSVSQSSEVTVWQSWSSSEFYFWYVLYVTFLLLDSGADLSILVLWSLRFISKPDKKTDSWLSNKLHVAASRAWACLITKGYCPAYRLQKYCTVTLATDYPP